MYVNLNLELSVFLIGLKLLWKYFIDLFNMRGYYKIFG